MRKHVFAGIVLIGIAAGSRALAAENAAPAPAPETPATASAKGKVRRALEKGMSAATVREIVGQPHEVKPMPVAEGSQDRAEMWVYRRAVGRRGVQVATGERDVPAFVGVGQAGDQIKTRKEIIYTLKHVTTYTVTSLLMLNDELVLARQTQETAEDFQ